MSLGAGLQAGGADAASPAWWRSRAWRIVGALSITETVSWGIVCYAFAVFLVPMQRELDLSTAQLTGAFSLALLVSAVAGIAVGRYLDRHSPRALMTAGSIAATALVLAWSQVDGLAAVYALWIGLGLVMAAVLYEPAFTVVAKWFVDDGERRGALTALTLVAALASFIFLCRFDQSARCSLFADDCRPFGGWCAAHPPNSCVCRLILSTSPRSRPYRPRHAR